MEPTGTGWGSAVAAAFVASGVTAVGILAARRRIARAPGLARHLVALAAGVLVAAALVHLLPHALEARPDAPLWALGGFVAMALMSTVAAGNVCDEAHDHAAGGRLALVGIGLHSFLDGLTYAVAFAAGALSGATVALGMILHELPEGLVSYALLARDGVPPRRATVIAFVAAGLTTPAGALVAGPLLAVLGPSGQAALAATTGGVLLHVGGVHLLGRVQRERAPLTVLAFLAGVGLALATAAVRH